MTEIFIVEVGVMSTAGNPVPVAPTLLSFNGAAGPVAPVLRSTLEKVETIAPCPEPIAGSGLSVSRATASTVVSALITTSPLKA